MARLKKVASLEDLGELNMPQDTINQILYAQGIDITVETPLYRRLMNQNTKFTVEMWSMSDSTFSVFSGTFNGMWTPGNIEYNGNFSSEAEAESYIQNNLQGQAEYGETVMVESRLKRNDFMKKHAAGDEPDYKKMATEFAREMNIPEVELEHKTSLNRYYENWQDYMEKYYPEWAKYPAFIWRGWSYFTDNFANESKQEETKEEPKEETPEVKEQEQENVQEEPEENTDPLAHPGAEVGVSDMGLDSGSGGSSTTN